MFPCENKFADTFQVQTCGMAGSVLPSANVINLQQMASVAMSKYTTTNI